MIWVITVANDLNFLFRMTVRARFPQSNEVSGQELEVKSVPRFFRKGWGKVGFFFWGFVSVFRIP